VPRLPLDKGVVRRTGGFCSTLLPGSGSLRRSATHIKLSEKPAQVLIKTVANPEALPPAIFLMGPTASGKTALALELAVGLPAEIVSVDSALVYRHMDIGTAKPDPASRARVPHHLIDLIDPNESYSAGRFRSDALQVMEDISARGKVPLLAGGTMLYFKALWIGLDVLPQANPQIRAALNARAKSSGWPALHKELSELDPITANRLKPTDAQRIQRALEVICLTGTPMSQMHGQATALLPYRVIAVALVPGSRSALHLRIAERFEAMLESGLIDEVRWLRAQFNLSSANASMRCVGYRQVCDFLDQKYDYSTLKEKGIAATRQLAKRQLTWLRAMRGIEQFDCFGENLADRVISRIRSSL
jgi:tRNA dimethylallyltransferase